MPTSPGIFDSNKMNKNGPAGQAYLGADSNSLGKLNLLGGGSSPTRFSKN